MTIRDLKNKWKQGDRPVLTAAGILGGLFFWLRFRLGIVNPARTDWLLGRADSAFHYLGWTFFRSESWRWPLGSMETYMAPNGTTVGLTDSLPLFALPFKVLSFLLPATFQYAGLWLLLCHVLMGIFAVRVAGLFFRSVFSRFFAAGILILCPAFLLRDGHVALTAHWVLLAALWLYLKPAPAGRKWGPTVHWLILVSMVALIHPYLAVMVFGFLMSDQIKRRWVKNEASSMTALLTMTGGAAVMLILWYLAGFFRFGQLPIGNFTLDVQYTNSLNAVWNSQGRSLLLPGLPLGSGDAFEGFNYFGAGGLLAALAAVLLGGGRKLSSRMVRHWPLILVLVVWGLFSLGPRAGFGEQLFRAQARFLWPLYYCLVVAGLAVISRSVRPRLPLVLTALLLAVQIVDLAPLFDRKTEYEAIGFTSRLQDSQWRRALEGANFLMTTPSSTATTVFDDDFVDLALLAHQSGVRTTAGFAARSYQENFVAADDLTRTFLFGGHPDPRTVGVLRRSHFAEMFPDFTSYLRCTDLDGFPVCFAREGGFRPDREYRVAAVGLADFLGAHQDKTMILVGKADVRGVLTRDAVELLAGLGSRIAQLPVGASYASIIVHGGLVFERMHPENAIEVTGERNTGMGSVLMIKELNITSSGSDTGKYASVKVDGREVLFNREGLNIAVLDDRQEVLAVATFGDLASLSGLAAKAGGLVFTLVPTQP